MAFFEAVLIYEYIVLYLLAVAKFWAVIIGGTKADMTVVAFGVLYAQQILLTLVIGGLVARIIQYFCKPLDVHAMSRVVGGLGGFIYPYDGRDFLKPEPERPKALQQVSSNPIVSHTANAKVRRLYANSLS